MHFLSSWLLLLLLTLIKWIKKSSGLSIFLVIKSHSGHICGCRILIIVASHVLAFEILYRGMHDAFICLHLRWLGYLNVLLVWYRVNLLVLSYSIYSRIQWLLCLVKIGILRHFVKSGNRRIFSILIYIAKIIHEFLIAVVFELFAIDLAVLQVIIVGMHLLLNMMIAIVCVCPSLRHIIPWVVWQPPQMKILNLTWWIFPCFWYWWISKSFSLWICYSDNSLTISMLFHR